MYLSLLNFYNCLMVKSKIQHLCLQPHLNGIFENCLHQYSIRNCYEFVIKIFKSLFSGYGT